MVFPSIPSYLDSSNWTQQQSHQTGSSSTNSLLPPAPALTQPPSHAAGGGSASVRPGSMTERARLASIPLPETALKCPRCESTNTKFCYFNNYNLSQPRHFCKTCRRYWTRGGALRNVPVGGGCRRNKRNKATNTTKSPANTTEEHITTTPRVSTGMVNLPQISPGRFMSPLGFTDNFPTSDVYANFPVENNFLGGHSGEPWRLQPPFLGGFDPSQAGVYQFHGGVEQASFLGDHNMRPKLSSSMMSQLSSVKLEENSRLNLSSRQLMGSDANWTDLSSFSSPSSNNPL